MGSRCQKNVIP